MVILKMFVEMTEQSEEEESAQWNFKDVCLLYWWWKLKVQVIYIHLQIHTNVCLKRKKTIWDDQQLFFFFLFLLAQMCIVKFALKGFLFSFRLLIAMQFIKLNFKPQETRLKSSGCYLYQSHNGWHQTRSRQWKINISLKISSVKERKWMFLSLLFFFYLFVAKSPWQLELRNFLKCFSKWFLFPSSRFWLEIL